MGVCVVFSVLENADLVASALRAGPSSCKVIIDGNKQGRATKNLSGFGQVTAPRMERAG